MNRRRKYTVTFKDADGTSTSKEVEATSALDAAYTAIGERWQASSLHEPNDDGWWHVEYVTHDADGYAKYAHMDFRLIVEDSLGYSEYMWRRT